eukprot:CAMPEP_0168723902 /NCGR_PEP_ID=MMETSP0724-20121128/3359_1 /TAXON_ID=265536 /ORGANISM="Amphiprora sp., Strain CCMP467" /LENGTH=538 /DNA_ID=CAMNT_0008770633 /DNA_START=11 /DNA_END=1625 /DNA_ORIENTATION=+
MAVDDAVASTTTTAPAKDFMECIREAWREYELQHEEQQDNVLFVPQSEFLLHHLILDRASLEFLAQAMEHSQVPKPQRFCFQFCTFASDVTEDVLAQILLTPGDNNTNESSSGIGGSSCAHLQSFRFQGIFNGNFARGESIAPILKMLGGSSNSKSMKLPSRTYDNKTGLLERKRRREEEDDVTTSTLRELQIGFTDLWSDPGDLDQYHQGCYYLKETLLNCPIASLDLFVCNLNLATVRALSEGIQGHQTLTKLCLNNCGLDDALLQDLVDFGLTSPLTTRRTPIACCSLEHLELPRNDLTIQSLISLTKLLQSHPNLRFLDLSENALFRFAYGHNNKIVSSFCNELGSHSSLEELVLRRVHLYNESAKLLFEALEGESSISTLYLEANPLQDGQWLNSLPSMKGLQNLSVEPYGGLSPRRAAETFGRNTKLQWLHLGGGPLNAYSMIRRNNFLQRVVNSHRRNVLSSCLPLSVWPLAIASLGGNTKANQYCDSTTNTTATVEPSGEAVYEFVQNVLVKSIVGPVEPSRHFLSFFAE